MGLVEKTTLAPAGRFSTGKLPLVPSAHFRPPKAAVVVPALYTSIISILFGEWMISVITRLGEDWFQIRSAVSATFAIPFAFTTPLMASV
ncbi:hypothetical protein D3C72_851750 [compost metagenome]